MRYLMVDISGKVPLYDKALCEALSKELAKSGNTLELLSANISSSTVECRSRKLISLVPSKFQNSENIIKRCVKALEGVLNYAYLIVYLMLHRCDVVHFQWLPFLEVASIESFFLRVIKFCSKQSKLILTIHNVYPHNSNDSDKVTYKKRFEKVEHFFDQFVVHLNTSKLDCCKEFNIEANKVSVIPHGVFSLQHSSRTRINDGKLQFLMYGNQSAYKGTDLLIDACNLLPPEYKTKIRIVVVGQMSQEFYVLLKSKIGDLDIEIVPHFISEERLCQTIENSDVLVFPYRRISQSGALLLALNYEKAIIASGLPTFRETLVGFDDDIFFESENAASLADVIVRFLNSEDLVAEQREMVARLRNKYSWKKIATTYANLLN